jgi:Ion channel
VSTTTSTVSRQLGARGTGTGPRYGLLMLATILSLAVQGMVVPSALQQVAVTALTGAALVLAFRAANLAPRLVALGAALAMLVLALGVVRAAAGGIGDGVTRTMNAALAALGPPAVAVGVIGDLRSSGQVRLQAVMGVLSLYMLLGMLFGFVYGAIDRFGGDPFFADGGAATVSRCLYFSFATLTTVGYGDLVARTDTGHTLAIFEALLGQIYLVTVVSLIVSNLGRRARPGGGERA